MSDSTKYGPMTIGKIVLLVIFVLIVLIVILQNTEEVETKLLFIQMKMPRALLLFLNLMIGFLLGMITMVVLRRRANTATKRSA